MTNTEAVKNEVAKVMEGKPVKSLQTLIEESAKELARALPDHMRPERLVRIALTCLRQNPELTKCTPTSLLGALFTAAQIGIEPVAKRAFILPFRNKRQINGEWKTVLEAQFVLGYPGVAELFYRHEKATQLAWGVVHEKDEFDYQYGTEPYLHHKPAKGERGGVLGYYVVAGLANGGKPFLYMTKGECLEHGQKHSKTYDKTAKKFYPSSPWVTSEDAMSLKTCFVQLSKLLPLSVEIQKAIASDESSRDYRSGVIDILSEPSTTNWEEEPFDSPKSDDRKLELKGE